MRWCAVLVDPWLPWAAPFTVLHWQEWKAVERRATKGQGAVRLEVLHLHGKVIQQATPKAAAASSAKPNGLPEKREPRLRESAWTAVNGKACVVHR